MPETISETPAKITFVAALLAPVTMKRAAKVSVIVGTILVFINQGDVIAAGMLPPIWKMVLTYMVPYSVSSYSTAAFMAELGQKR
ncbi:MAG: nitrate/nitrite transporter NrtS [Pseudomonadota bacterium]